jgi:hypothetical protein
VAVFAALLVASLPALMKTAASAVALGSAFVGVIVLRVSFAHALGSNSSIALKLIIFFLFWNDVD